MEELKEDKQIELRSEEVQEIMGQVPPWIQRWDITVMAFLMVLFLGISWFFKFPQSLNAQVTLTTATPPAELHARSSGQLDFVAVKDKERVEAGTVLAVIRNTANFRDMSELATLYHNWKSGKITADSMCVFGTERMAGRRVAVGVFGFQAEFGKLPELSKKELLSTQNSLKKRGTG